MTIKLHNSKIVTNHRRRTTPKSLPMVEPASYLPMVERFGAYFKDLTLVYVGSKYPMLRDCVEVIQCLTRCCRYDRLALDVSTQVCGIVEGVEPNTTDMSILARLVTDAYCLKSFELDAWPDYPRVSNIDMLEVLLSNGRMNGSLEHLSLYCHSAGSTTWAPLNITVPTPGQMMAVTSRFTQLRDLYVLSSMVCGDLIVGLSDKGRSPLRELGILVMYTSRKPDGGLPHIEASSWTRLHTHSPCLQVHVRVMTRMPVDKLFGFLRSEIPVASISFMPYSECRDVRSIADRFSSTLRKFVDLSTYSSGLDAELVYMVTKCSQLVHLEYNGTLLANTIRDVAGLRGSRWLHFLVNFDNAVTHDVDTDDDVIIKKGDDNSYYVVKIRQLAESTGDNRIVAIEQLTADVALLIS